VRKMEILHTPLSEIVSLLTNSSPEPTDSIMFFIAGIFNRNAQPDSARSWYTRLTNQYPASPLCARALLDLADLVQADSFPCSASLAFLQRAAKAFPEMQQHDQVFERILSCLLSSGTTDERIDWLTRWIAASPESQEPIYLIATAYREKEDFRLAARYYQIYILKYPDGQWIEDAYQWTWKSYEAMQLTADYKRVRDAYRSKFPLGKWIEDIGSR
jgi:tetratricopeptide (TPR) repeat protein